MKKLLTFSILFLLVLQVLPGVRAGTEPYVYMNNVEEPSSIEEIQSHLTANDVLDGDLSNEIYVVHDAYSGNENKLGDYAITFGVMDSIGQETMTTIIVRNKDVTPPEIILVNPLSLRIPQYASFQSNRPNVKAIDSYDGDITHLIVITGTVDTTTLGDYELTYTVSDKSGNTATKTFTVQVVDVTPPELTGPTEIVKHAEYILSSNFYLNYFQAHDDQDGDISHRIRIVSNEYVGNADKRGDYKIRLAVSDNAGNEVYHDLVIKVRTAMIPLLIIDNEKFLVSHQRKLTENDFIEILKNINAIPNATYSFFDIYDNYTSNYQRPGIYVKNFHLQSSSGLEYTHDLRIEVITYAADYIQADPNGVAVVMSFLKSWWWALLIAGFALYGMTLNGTKKYRRRW